MRQSPARDALRRLQDIVAEATGAPLPQEAERRAQAVLGALAGQGTEAGGHTGKIATLALLPQVIDAVDPIPVVAAGGVADGRALAAVLAMGAIGAWCGTAFLVA